MLSVIIPRDLIIVPVNLVSLEMEVIALVMTCLYYCLAVVKVIVRLDFAVERQSLRTKLFSSAPDVIFNLITL